MVENNKINICEELGQNFIDFSYEANSARAFADARDGLKPGQRACLWEMFNSGYNSTKPHVKSAKIAGAVTGNWWPHGDVAIYETFARMSQPWINNIPEVDWHGNNGSQYSGPECASSRYTEARLAKIVEEGMFAGIKKNNVNMIQNFSEDALWPEVLPAIFPRLMVNGCQGIGSTIANVWIPFNFKEVTDSLIKYMKTKEIDISNLYPDFPTAGILINKKDIHTILETGKGKAIVRGRAEIKKNIIYITELPYQVYAQPYVEKITEMAIKDELIGIEAVYNKSGKNKLLIEIECNGSPDHVLRQLYSKTELQKSYNANQWALVGKTPKLLTFKNYCEIYLTHNLECLIKEYNFDLDKAKARLEIVNGLLIALEDIDNIIALIKKSASSADAKTNLISKYNFTENQAKAIVDMKLGKIAGLEKIEIQNEQKELEKTIAEINNILSSEEQQIQILITRLAALVKKYGDDRRTELLNIEVKSEEKEIETVTPEDVIVILSQTGDIKRIAKSSFKTQRKGGKGIKTEDDAVLDTIATNTIDNLLIFTNTGKMYKLLVDNIPVGTNASKGVKISTLINLDANEKVIAITSLERKNNKKYVVFITKNGLFKKTLLEEYTKTKRTTGIAAISLKEGDSIANIELMDEEEMIIITKNGQSIHFETKDIAAIGRATSGVKTIKLAEKDEVLIGIPIRDSKAAIAVFTEKGFAKKTNIEDFPIQGRTGKGVVVYKETPGSGRVVGAKLVTDEDNILLIGKKSICISATDIPLLGRVANGNLMIKEGNISSVVKL